MNYFIGVMVILRFLVVFMYPSSCLLGRWGVVDSIRVGLVLLSGFVTFLIIYSSYKVKRYNENYVIYYVLIVLLYFVLIFSFFTSDLLIFYFYFEVSLIPTLIIIIGWGYQPERLQAGVYFIFYTLFASLPLLIFINYIYYY
jgi:NADH-ubiquinone oxidoreductase chain 4